MNFRCFFRHDTTLAEGQTIGVLACRRCGAILEHWSLLRPEQQVRQARADAAFWADRERRAQAMTMPTIRASKVLRMPR